MHFQIIVTIMAFATSATAIPVEGGDAGVVNATEVNGAEAGGYATYYYQNGGTGSCGERHNDNENLCSVSPSRISGRCGHPCRLFANGQTLYGRVVDTCTLCSNEHVDVSVGAFRTLSNNNLGAGHISLDWDIL